jgi:hypothetical protein
MGFVANGGDQYATVHGLASDDVARLELYLADGERIAVPLTDDAYLIQVARTKFPIRLVAYDIDERIIAINALGHDPPRRLSPAPLRSPCRLHFVSMTVEQLVSPWSRMARSTPPSRDSGRSRLWPRWPGSGRACRSSSSRPRRGTGSWT